PRRATHRELPPGTTWIMLLPDRDYLRKQQSLWCDDVSMDARSACEQLICRELGPATLSASVPSGGSFYCKLRPLLLSHKNRALQSTVNERLEFAFVRKYRAEEARKQVNCLLAAPPSKGGLSLTNFKH